MKTRRLFLLNEKLHRRRRAALVFEIKLRPWDVVSEFVATSFRFRTKIKIMEILSKLRDKIKDDAKLVNNSQLYIRFEGGREEAN